MPNYTTLNDQVELFKTKVSALTSTTLDANELVLLASALDTLAKALGVNDILAATNDRIDALNAARDAAITTINNSVNGDRITALETTSTSYGTRLTTVENYVNTNQGNLSALSSTVTSLDAAVRPNVMNAYQVITASSYTAVRSDRLLVIPTAGQTITLPVAPVTGDTIFILDGAGTSATTNFTIARNGQNINGLAENLVFNVNGGNVTLIYVNSTYGWRIV